MKIENKIKTTKEQNGYTQQDWRKKVTVSRQTIISSKRQV